MSHLKVRDRVRGTITGRSGVVTGVNPLYVRWGQNIHETQESNLNLIEKVYRYEESLFRIGDGIRGQVTGRTGIVTSVAPLYVLWEGDTLPTETSPTFLRLTSRRAAQAPKEDDATTEFSVHGVYHVGNLLYDRRTFEAVTAEGAAQQWLDEVKPNMGRNQLGKELPIEVAVNWDSAQGKAQARFKYNRSTTYVKIEG